MQQDEFWSGKLAEMVQLIERQERGEEINGPGETDHWLAGLKREVEARKMAEAQAQYRKDALLTRLMFEINRVRAVELLEEMNHELLDMEGRIEPIFTSRHELCLSWSAPGGRNKIRVGAEFDETETEIFLIVTGREEHLIVSHEDSLKKALIKAFKDPCFEIFRW